MLCSFPRLWALLGPSEATASHSVHDSQHFPVPSAPERLLRDRECLLGRPTDSLPNACLRFIFVSLCCMLYERTYHLEYITSDLFFWKRSKKVMNVRQELPTYAVIFSHIIADFWRRSAPPQVHEMLCGLLCHVPSKSWWVLTSFFTQYLVYSTIWRFAIFYENYPPPKDSFWTISPLLRTLTGVFLAGRCRRF